MYLYPMYPVLELDLFFPFMFYSFFTCLTLFFQPLARTIFFCVVFSLDNI